MNSYLNIILVTISITRGWLKWLQEWMPTNTIEVWVWLSMHRIIQNEIPAHLKRMFKGRSGIIEKQVCCRSDSWIFRIRNKNKQLYIFQSQTLLANRENCCNFQLEFGRNQTGEPEKNNSKNQQTTLLTYHQAWRASNLLRSCFFSWKEVKQKEPFTVHKWLNLA